jgi:hypothetical protein
MGDHKRYLVKPKWGGKKPRVVHMTPAKAVKAFCLEHFSYHSKKIRECPHYDCSLHSYRMGKHNHPNINVQIRDAIAEYCLECSDGQVTKQCDLCLLKPWKRFVRESVKKAKEA